MVDTLSQYMTMKWEEAHRKPAYQCVLAPSKLVDLAWHSHIIDTKSYAAFCQVGPTPPPTPRPAAPVAIPAALGCVCLMLERRRCAQRPAERLWQQRRRAALLYSHFLNLNFNPSSHHTAAPLWGVRPPRSWFDQGQLWCVAAPSVRRCRLPLHALWVGAARLLARKLLQGLHISQQHA